MIVHVYNIIYNIYIYIYNMLFLSPPHHMFLVLVSRAGDDVIMMSSDTHLCVYTSYYG